jgi:flavin reductase (DIM6/NTAB) family NADH-FMN oxidoreductase RutF
MTAERTEFAVAEVDPRSIYPFLTASLIPRPIAWVSTRSAAGVDNVAPHSFTTVAGVDPPTLCFTSVGHKDTLANARATGEFVLNIGTETLLHQMNDTGTGFPPEDSEFDAAGLEREPSSLVTPARVAAAPIAFECRVSGEHAIGRSVMVFGEVLLIAVSTSVLAADGLPDARLLAPLARLGRNEWATLGELINLKRIPHDEWLRGRRSATTGAADTSVTPA